MSENNDKPPTVEPGPVLRNCWTCGWDVKDSRGTHRCLTEDSADVLVWQDDQWWSPRCMPADDADNCPGWKPKPEQANTDRAQPTAIPAHDIPGHRPNVDREQVAHLGGAPIRPGEWMRGCGVDQVPAVEHSEVATIEDFSMVENTHHDIVTVRRAEWDALLADIAAMESRVGDLDRRQRTDNARAQALRRRDKLRGAR